MKLMLHLTGEDAKQMGRSYREGEAIECDMT